MTTKTETILLVEDEDALRALARTVLERQGYRVIPASNGREALDRARGHDGLIDLLVTDLVMPEMGGLALVEEFGRRSPQSRVLLMSGDTEDVSLPCLEKPFLPRMLLGRVRELLGPVLA